MKKVLLTGATGFIGRHSLQTLLACGYEVHAVSSGEQATSIAGVYWHRVNLLDEERITELTARVKPTHLLHFAWIATPGVYWTSIENLRWVQASLSLLQAFVRHGGQRAVVAGTCAEYDWTNDCCSEDATPLVPATLYGTCKHALQIMLRAFSDEVELSAAWGRIFFLYGPHEHPDRLVPYVVRSMLRGEPVRCSHGNQVRDFLYVQDVADAFVALLESDVTGALNIASGQAVKLKDVVYEIADELNGRDTVELGAVPAPAGEPARLIADTRRLTDEVKWSPKYDLRRGLEQTIQWWRKELARAG